jgi:tetratricopeptide (TPR) repeat protein
MYYLALPYALSIILFFITSRYRIPLVLFLIPGSAYAMTSFYEQVRNRNWRRAVFYSLVFVPVFILSSMNPFAVGSKAEPRGYYSLGVDYTHSDLRRALDAFDRSINIDPTYAPAWKMRGWTHNRLGHLPEAASDLENACRLDSSFFDAFLLLGAVYQKQGRHAEALSSYEHALRLDPDHATLLTNIADVHMRSEKMDSAFRYLERALRADPELPNALYGMGYYHELDGDLDKALTYYYKALEFKPARLRVVLVLAKSNRSDEAERFIRQLPGSLVDAEEITLLRKILATQGR